jgi:hypothetical protein
LFNRSNGSQFLGANPILVSNNIFYDFNNDVNNIDILSLSNSLVYFQVNNITSNINETTFQINSTLQYPSYKSTEKSVTGVIIEPLLIVTFTSNNPLEAPVNKVTVVRVDSRLIDMTLTIKNVGNAVAYDVYIVQEFDSQLIPINGSFFLNSTSLSNNMTFSYNSSTGNISKMELTLSNIDPFTTTTLKFQYYTAFLGPIGSFYSDILSEVDYRSTSLLIPSSYNRFYNTSANHTIGFSLVPIVEFYTFYYFDGEYLSYNTPGKEVGNEVTVYSANVGEGLLLNMIIFLAPTITQ